jgi:hypothetical protein
VPGRVRHSLRIISRPPLKNDVSMTALLTHGN